MEATACVVAVVGLPGSGKTRYMAETFARGWFMIDDFGDNETWGRDAWDRNLRILRCVLENGGRAVVSDVGFCAAERLGQFTTAFPETQCIYFENDPAQCELNVRVRYEVQPGSYLLRDYLSTTCRYAAQYRPPPDALPVWKRETTP
jgi:hypothetical protein